MIDTIYSDPNFLQHHGVKGMKWGVRRYQNEDGTLTNKGKKKYIKEMYKDMDATYKRKVSDAVAKTTKIQNNGRISAGSRWNDAARKGKVTSDDYKNAEKAASETRAYMKNKYGDQAVKALAKSGVLFTPVSDLGVPDYPLTGIG